MDFAIKRSRILGRDGKYINGSQAIAYEYCLQVARALLFELSENALASLSNLDANPGRCPPHRPPGLFVQLTAATTGSPLSNVKAESPTPTSNLLPS